MVEKIHTLPLPPAEAESFDSVSPPLRGDDTGSG